MARRYARLLTSIWTDPDFTALTADAQRLYLLVISQPELNAAGVLPLRAKWWATKGRRHDRRRSSSECRDRAGEQRGRQADPGRPTEHQSARWPTPPPKENPHA